MKKNKPDAVPLAVAIAKPVKVPMLKTGDDAEVIAKFEELFKEAQNGVRRIVAFGIYAEQVKTTKLKHSQFGPWVKASFPEISYRSVRAHMQLAESALKAAGFKSLKAFFNRCLPFQNGSVCHFAHCGELLLLPEKGMPDDAIEMRGQICKVIDGKSARQLFAEFKQADEDDESDTPKRGRLKGKGGASAAQRAKAKAATEAAEIEAMELWAEEAEIIIQENADDAHWGRIADDKAAKLLEVLLTGADYLKGLINRRKSAKEGK